jgi:CRP-like cAMP-binding protein
MSSIEDDISFLESVPLFRLVGRAPLRIIAMGAETQIVHEDQVLFDDPDVVDAGYVVKHGRFGLRGARETDPAFMAGSGALLGELALISETARPSPVTALELSTVIRIPRSLFIKMLDGYPDAALRLRDHMAARTEQTISEITRLRTALDTAGAKA